jgi:hypothetical protein
MNRTLAAVVAVIVVLGGIAWYVYQGRQESAAPPPAAVETVPEPAPLVVPEAPQPEVEAPAPVAPPPAEFVEEEPLPALEESDAYVSATLGGLVGEAAVMRYFAGENIVDKAVATVSALDGRQVPKPILALHGPGDEYPAIPITDPETVIRDAAGDPVPQYRADPAAYARYRPYVEMLEAVEPGAFVDLLREHEELFDESFRQLGYANGRFEDRLAQIIDQLLATPAVDEPLRLVKPEAFYLFADERLEALSAGQKILLRMGNDNAARVKSWLSEVRKTL